MARITVPDWNAEYKKFCETVGRAAEYVTTRMVQAGGNAAADEMKRTSAWADDSGQMRLSIKPSNVKRGRYGGLGVEVYPQGTNREGQRMQTIGFVLEHGRTGRVIKKRGKKKGKTIVIHPMAPRPWMKQAMEDAQPAISQAMRREFDRITDAYERMKR